MQSVFHQHGNCNLRIICGRVAGKPGMISEFIRDILFFKAFVLGKPHNLRCSRFTRNRQPLDLDLSSRTQSRGQNEPALSVQVVPFGSAVRLVDA